MGGAETAKADMHGAGEAHVTMEWPPATWRWSALSSTAMEWEEKVFVRECCIPLWHAQAAAPVRLFTLLRWPSFAVRRRFPNVGILVVKEHVYTCRTSHALQFMTL
ncbi:hypothetical protein SEVIR_8G233850v4 [Setaria viridis]